MKELFYITSNYKILPFFKQKYPSVKIPIPKLLQQDEILVKRTFCLTLFPVAP